MKAFFAFKLLIRDWRSGEIKILMAALIIAVTALTSISFYIDRVNRGVEAQSAELLGGDLSIKSTQKIPDSWLIKAAQLNLQFTQVLLFPTMAVNNEQLQLINVKAVSDNYPLKGKIRTSENLNAPDMKMNTTPSAGTAWVDGQLLALLNITPGNNFKIGEAQFTLTRILTYQPDAQSNWFNIAPQVLMNISDVKKTHVVTPGSRVEYRLLLSGTPVQIKNYLQWLRPQLTSAQKISTLKEGQPQLMNIITRTMRYLNLAIMICVILAGITIAVSARHYCERHYDHVALLRCFGATQRRILSIFTVYLLALGTIAGIIGCLLGYLAQMLYENIFSFWIHFQLAAPSLKPLLLGLITSIVILIGFAAPAFFRLKNITPLHVLKRNLTPMPVSILAIYGLPILTLFGLLAWYTTDFHLALFLLYSLLLTGLGLYVTGYALIKLTRLFHMQTTPGWRNGLAALARDIPNSSVQLIAFGLIIMVVALIAIIRNDLINSWQQQLSSTTPNYFAINIQPEDKNNFVALLNRLNIKNAGVYPMVRGRLTALNGIPIKQAVAPQARENNALNRELNLTWTMQLPSDNKIVSGKWWSSQDKDSHRVSIEQGLAHDLGIKLGDKLSFQIADQTLEVYVQSIRSLEWDSFHPNFFMIFPPGILDNMPMTYITSFHSNQNNILAALIKPFPSVTIIDVAELLQQIRAVIDKIVYAIQYLLLFTLLAGIAVLYAAIQASSDMRLYEGAVMRVLGASRRQLQRSTAAEFISLGLLAGLWGSACAALIGYFLATAIFELDYHFNFLIFISGIIGGAILTGTLGILATHSLIKHPPLQMLREI